MKDVKFTVTISLGEVLALLVLLHVLKM